MSFGQRQHPLYEGGVSYIELRYRKRSLSMTTGPTAHQPAQTGVTGFDGTDHFEPAQDTVPRAKPCPTRTDWRARCFAIRSPLPRARRAKFTSPFPGKAIRAAKTETFGARTRAASGPSATPRPFAAGRRDSERSFFGYRRTARIWSEPSRAISPICSSCDGQP